MEKMNTPCSLFCVDSNSKKKEPTAEGTYLIRKGNRFILTSPNENIDFNTPPDLLYEILKEKGYPEFFETEFPNDLDQVFDFGKMSVDLSEKRKPNLWRFIQDLLEGDIDETLDTSIDGIIIDITDSKESQEFFFQKGYCLHRSLCSFQGGRISDDIHLYITHMQRLNASYELLEAHFRVIFGNYFNLIIFQKAYLTWQLSLYIATLNTFEIEEEELKYEFHKTFGHCSDDDFGDALDFILEYEIPDLKIY